MVRHMEPMIRRGQMKDVAHKTLGDLGLGQVPVLSVGPDARVIDAINMISKNKVGQTICASWIPSPTPASWSRNALAM